MTVHVLLFAAAKAAIGQATVAVELPAAPRVADIRAELQRRFPALQPLLARSWIAVNQQVAAVDYPVAASDEVAWIPPVSGG